MISSLFLALLVLPAQVIERVSVNSFGIEANSNAQFPDMTPDGRFVVFSSYADNLVPGDTNGNGDYFVHDRQLGTTERVSVTSGGGQAGFGPNALGWVPGAAQISADGRFVAFSYGTDDLVPGDTNQVADVFVRDRFLDVTRRVSVSSAGNQADGTSKWFSLSADGRLVAFSSEATNLVPGFSSISGLYVHDLTSGTTRCVSVDPAGVPVLNVFRECDLSADGRYLAFTSSASNLVANDTNGTFDIFVRDLALEQTARVNLTSTGAEVTDGWCMTPTISADGQTVVFKSTSGQLVPGGGGLVRHVYWRDLRTGAVERVSVSGAGVPASTQSDSGGRVSDNGDLVLFESFAWNLGGSLPIGPSNETFLRDVRASTTAHISTPLPGLPTSFGGNSRSMPALSPDGQFQAFQSQRADLVLGDTNGSYDIFVRDKGVGSGKGAVLLTAGLRCIAGQPLRLRWYGAEPNADYWIFGSASSAGAVWGGHSFNLGPPVYIVGTGTIGSSGHGSALTPAIPPGLIGVEVHFELATRTPSGVIGDSNICSRPVF